MTRLLDEAGPNDAVYEFTQDAYDSALVLLAPGEEWRRLRGLVRLKFPRVFLRLPLATIPNWLLSEQPDGWIHAAGEDIDGVLGGVGFNPHLDNGIEFAALAAFDEHRYAHRQVTLPDDLVSRHANGLALYLAFLNMPKLARHEFVSSDKENNKRRARGRPPIPHKTVIHASSIARQYLEFKRHEAAGTLPEHWVGGHWHLYWCGPRANQHLEPRWVAPYKRGDSVSGTLPPRYDVRG